MKPEPSFSKVILYLFLVQLRLSGLQSRETPYLPSSPNSLLGVCSLTTKEKVAGSPHLTFHSYQVHISGVVRYHTEITIR